MNLIQSQAEDFYKIKYGGSNSYQDFIQELRWQLNEYYKIQHKLEFIETLQLRLRIDYDEHLTSCKYRDKDRLKCQYNKAFENTLFFIQNEKEELLSTLPETNFTLVERESVSETLSKILEELQSLKLGQQITYDDLYDEFQDLKDFYFLDKKHWSELFAGKLLGMISAGVISESISKDIVESIQKHYPDLF